MFNYIISILFLVILIIPIGYFMLILYGLTIEEVRLSHLPKKEQNNHEPIKEVSIKQRLKLVK
ncbi:hypothetical protein F8154_02270 [Alkaliphilus pronyensis]|uniref:Uncharacterized protein n=1 Tax=Alkaliphilus pronyensis TaxID=1482732 RepID=A0A6I0FF12_9FIRM|nr:hypothetical protein [Alkaliphilus pronyensis]KAB3537826.1 hypothetical protein F8154_02270 [Alkaliphilus pronyensis]